MKTHQEQGLGTDLSLHLRFSAMREREREKTVYVLELMYESGWGSCKPGWLSTMDSIHT